MKPLKPFRQSPGLCGPASLKILLSHYGKKFTEAELAMLCNATADAGTNHDDMVKAMQSLGFEVRAKANASLQDLKTWIKKETPVMVGWWSSEGTPGDHFSVVYHFDLANIFLMDPELESGMRKMTITDFEKNWHDFDGTDNHRVDRWMMVLQI